MKLMISPHSGKHLVTDSQRISPWNIQPDFGPYFASIWVYADRHPTALTPGYINQEGKPVVRRPLE